MQACIDGRDDRDDRDHRDKKMSKLQVIYSFIMGYEEERMFRSSRDEYYELETQQDKMKLIQLHAENTLELYVDWTGAHIIYLAIEGGTIGSHEADLMYESLDIDDENEVEKVALLKKLRENRRR